MKKVLFAGACWVALAFLPVMAQTSKPDVVMVRGSDAASSGRLAVVREGGQTEGLEVANGVNAQALALPGTPMQQGFGKLYAAGYTLKGTFGGSQGYVATLGFVKGQ